MEPLLRFLVAFAKGDLAEARVVLEQLPGVSARDAYTLANAVMPPVVRPFVGAARAVHPEMFRVLVNTALEAAVQSGAAAEELVSGIAAKTDALIADRDVDRDLRAAGMLR
jgi:hypothetical protein